MTLGDVTCCQLVGKNDGLSTAVRPPFGRLNDDKYVLSGRLHLCDEGNSISEDDTIFDAEAKLL